MYCPNCGKVREDFVPPAENSSELYATFAPSCPHCGSEYSPAKAAIEPGCWENHMGQVIYAYPPEGRFADLWKRLTDITTEDERSLLQCLISNELNANAVPVAYMDTEDGIWHDVSPDWDNPPRWADGMN